MKKIVVTQNLLLSPEQKNRLMKLGDVTFYNKNANTPEIWLKRCKDADIICTGKFGLKQKIYELSNVFISIPFVDGSWIDKKKITQKNIIVSNSPGCNKCAVSEWIIGMMINLLRNLHHYINIKKMPINDTHSDLGLKDKNITILGAGNIGSRVGKICQSLEMNVSYFRKGDNLLKSAKNADVIVDSLSSNPSTKGLLDKKFFGGLKKGSYFITVTGNSIVDLSAMFEALDNGILAGVATDVANIQARFTSEPEYIKLRSHPKILATPHIAHSSDSSEKICSNSMIDNVEAWIKNKPINLV